jgi:aspartokinase/homoserine dehydrogenase 1
VHTLTRKFGGTSVGDADAIRRVVSIVQDAGQQAEHVVVVVSAMSGVTDMLLAGAQQAASGDNKAFRKTILALRDKHYAAARTLLGEEGRPVIQQVDRYLGRHSSFCESVHVLGEVTPRALDYIASLGERMSARLVSAALSVEGVPAEAVNATRLIVTDDNFQAAAPLWDQTCAQVRHVLPKMLDKGIVPVVTGFIGATEEGVTTTLGRGGSDFSAAIVGMCLGCDEVWIWSDVDGVMSADPRAVPEARTIPTLGYREVSELAYFGAKVLHPKTIRPVVEAGIPLRIKNTFNPANPGTLVLPDSEVADGAIKAVTKVPGLSIVVVQGKGMLGVPGIAARTFAAVAEARANVLMISQASSEQSICFAVQADQAPAVVEVLRGVFALELARSDIDRIWEQRDVEIITVVGQGVLDTPGIAGQVFTATGQAGINAIAIAQGASECSISLAVDAGDGDAALRCIHNLAVQPVGDRQGA